MFSSYILEGWLVLHLCYRKSGLCSVVLWDGWPRLACVQLYCRTAGLGWLVFGSIAGQVA